jgi:hypothetical protein
VASPGSARQTLVLQTDRSPDIVTRRCGASDTPQPQRRWLNWTEHRPTEPKVAGSNPARRVAKSRNERLLGVVIRCGTGAYPTFLAAEPVLGPTPRLPLTSIHWVIVGGESGPVARPIQIEWVRQIRDRCPAHGVPFFFKQRGSAASPRSKPISVCANPRRGRASRGSAGASPSRPDGELGSPAIMCAKGQAANAKSARLLH